MRSFAEMLTHILVTTTFQTALEAETLKELQKKDKRYKKLEDKVKYGLLPTMECVKDLDPD